MSDEEMVSPALFAEAANMDTSPKRLVDLARFAALQPLVAANPATPSTTLEQLSTASDPTIRRAVALNPNASVQTLCHLAGEFPQEFLHNPVLPILNMTRPGFINGLPFFSWASLLRFETIPRAWVQRIAADKWYQRSQQPIWRVVQLHVAHAGEAIKPTWRREAESASKEYWQKKDLSAVDREEEEREILFLLTLLLPHCIPMLKKQWVSAVRSQPRLASIAISLSPAIDGKTLSLLAHERNGFILAQVARHPNIPVNVLEQLAGRRHSDVRRAAASNPRTPQESIRRLASDDTVVVRRAAASHPALTSDDHEILALDGERSVRVALATVARLDPDLLAQLAHDPEPEVRAAVARNVKVTVAILTQLAGDAEPVVRAAAARNVRLPDEIQYVLVTDPEVSVRASVSENAWLAERCHAVLALDSSPVVRSRLAVNPSISAALLESFWQAGDMEIWLGVARNPQASPELLTRLVQQGDVRVRAAVAAHKRTPVEVLNDLALENVREIWHGLARNPHTPLAILERALATPHVELRYRLFNHPTMVRHQRLPYLTLLASRLQQRMVANRFPAWLRKVIFQYHRAFPPTLLELLAHSPYWEERYFAARSPRITDAVLDVLARDGICYVRAAAQDALQRRNPSMYRDS